LLQAVGDRAALGILAFKICPSRREHFDHGYKCISDLGIPDSGLNCCNVSRAMTVLVRDVWVGTSTEKRLNIRWVAALNRDE
jgi:hypothetical protein